MRSLVALVLSVVCWGAVATPVDVWVAPFGTPTHAISEPGLRKYFYNVSGDNSLGVVVNLDLLEDERIADDVISGLEEEFSVVDEELGETAEGSNAKLTKKSKRKDRRLSPIYQGVYIPDPRFNAFVDGVMVNMIAEMRRRRMDPLYFRVLDKGRVEHVPTHRRVRRAEGRAARQAAKEAIGGGVIRGLSRIRRFGNSEVQVAGNSTLARGHWLCGPLDVIIDYRNGTGITRVRTGLQAVQFDTLTVIDRFGAEMETFNLISPFFEHMPYAGNRTVAQQATTDVVVKYLFSNRSFMTGILREAFEVASYDKIIPQFGTDSSYYSVLQYLLKQKEEEPSVHETKSTRDNHYHLLPGFQ